MKMLTIKTDEKNRAWLIYIVQEFKRINAASFEISVVDVNDSKKYENCLFYTREYIHGLSIVNTSQISPDKGYIKLRDGIHVIQDTRTKDKRFTCEYDIFWNSFVILSRLEEFLSENNGKKILSYSFKHPRKDKETFGVPVANNIFNELEMIVRKYFPQLTFDRKEEPVIELSHDVDYIRKTNKLRFKQTLFNGYNILKVIRRPKALLKRCSRTIRFFVSNPSYWCFDFWEELEKKHNKRSIFYVYVKTKTIDFRSWMLDPSYNIEENKQLQQHIKNLLEDGFKIGLHGSYNSAVNENLLREEKERLENCIDTEINQVRQHWLRYEENSTPYIHNALFRYDSTLGWNDRMGFRNGCASVFKPFDHRNRKPFEFFEIPQIIMDSTIFDYTADKTEYVEQQAVNMMESLKNLWST